MSKIIQCKTLFKIALFPATLLAAWFYAPHSTHGPTLCLWKNLTGHACPGCGLTRAICSLVHGQFHEALAYNWTAPAVLLFFAWISISTTQQQLKETPWLK